MSKAAVWISLLALATAPGWVVAAPDIGAGAPGAAGASPTDDTTTTKPYAQVDSDGVPLSVTQQSSRHPLTNEQIEVLRLQAEQDAHDRNWLMIEYEKQQEAHAGADGQKTTNIYLQLSMDKNLAELADLEHTKAENSTPAPELHATPTVAAANSPTLRPESPSPQDGFNPELSAPSAASASVIENLDFASSLFSPPDRGTGITGTGPFVPSTNDADTATAAKPVAAHSQAYMEATDMQTPGMVAAQDPAMGDAASPDLSLDSLPTETEQEAREAAASTPPELPQAMSADSLHAIQDAQIAAPTLAAQTKVAPSIVLAKKADAEKPQMVPVNPDDAPMQVTKQPMVNPVHPTLNNPLDVLRR